MTNDQLDVTFNDLLDIAKVTNNLEELKVSTQISKQFLDDRGNIQLDPDEVDLVLADMERLISYVKLLERRNIK